MSRADYSHWNEDADRIWWEEEGRHVEEPPFLDDDEFFGDYDDAADAFAEECWETETVTLIAWLCDADRRRRFPKEVPIIIDALNDKLSESSLYHGLDDFVRFLGR